MIFGIIGAIFAGLVLLIALENRRSKRSIGKYLTANYGRPHDNAEERRERIADAANLYLHDVKKLSGTEIVDDITWDDLGMDDIFVSADHTDSYAGAQYLYSRMRRLDATEDELHEHDKRAAFFDKNEEKRLAVRRHLHSIGQVYSGFRLIDNIDIIGSAHLKFRKAFPVLGLLLLGTIIAAAVTHNPVLMFLGIVILMANMIIHTLTKGMVDVQFQTILNAAAVISAARNIAEEVPEFSKDIKPDIEKMSGMLRKARYLIFEKNAEVTKDMFMNILFFFINTFMIDLFCYDIVIDDLDRNAEEFRRIYRFAGSMDYDISLASYRRYIGNYCIPEFTEKPEMELKGVCHPMIKNAVRNDFVQKRSTIITGSNASGKSTFIKSAALALIMGQTLHTCHAESAVIPRCGVMTSMAVRDDLLSGESYYIREIKYLKRMVELCESGKTMFLAVDEILRGTNTRERIAASKALMEYFSKQNCMVIVATHDIELAEYFAEKCDNFHFCEKVEDGNVVFDYKMHEGISRTSNAIRLLGAMGFPESIVADAEKYVE